MNAQQLVMLALQVSILMTVFGFGLQTTAADVLYLLRRPSLLGRSLAAMFVVMPLLAVAASRVFALTQPVQIALVALSISPVPPMLPGKQGKAGGYASYALGLMAVAGLSSIAIVPFGAHIVGVYFGRTFAMPPMAIAKVVLSAAFLPLAAGMACRSWLPAVADRVEGPIATVAKIVLVAGTVALLFAAAPAEWALRGSGRIPAFAAFVVLGLLVGHVVGGPREEERLVLALSVACRHPAIALAVAEANFPDSPNLALAILLYVVVSVVVSAVYLAVERRRLLAEAPAP